jgi:hypothetical protein
MEVHLSRGGMCERLKQAVLKTAVPARVPGVRIPLPPPLTTDPAIHGPQNASFAQLYHGATENINRA